MATQTTHFHLSKPDANDKFSDFRQSYNNNMDIIDNNLGGGGGGRRGACPPLRKRQVLLGASSGQARVLDLRGSPRIQDRGRFDPRGGRIRAQVYFL